jgi:hypothetical protein
MPALDPKQLKLNISLAKTALKKAEIKKEGKDIRVGFAFAPGKEKKEHILVIDPRKKGQALMAEILKKNKDRKQICCGTATVHKEGGKKTMSIIYVKKLPGAERRMQEALKAMSLMYVVKLEKEDEDEDIAEVAEDVAEALDAAGDDDDDAETADAGDDAEADEDEDEQTADADEDDEDEDRETADAGDDEDDDEDAETAEADEDDDEEVKQPATAAPKAAPEAAAKLAALGAAPKVWHQARGAVNKSIEALCAAIDKEYENEAPDLKAEIKKGMSQLNRILERFDHKLAEQIEKAHKAASDAARKVELAKCQTMLKDHIKYIMSEPLIKHIDTNPFVPGVQVGKTLTMTCKHIGDVLQKNNG